MDQANINSVLIGVAGVITAVSLLIRQTWGSWSEQRSALKAIMDMLVTLSTAETDKRKTAEERVATVHAKVDTMWLKVDELKLSVSTLTAGKSALKLELAACGSALEKANGRVDLLEAKIVDLETALAAERARSDKFEALWEEAEKKTLALKESTDSKIAATPQTPAVSPTITSVLERTALATERTAAAVEEKGAQ